jgi:hypothetical protein
LPRAPSWIIVTVIPSIWRTMVLAPPFSPPPSLPTS